MHVGLRCRLSAVVVLSLIGCANPSGPRPSLTGEWSGVADGRAISLQLTDAQGAITGTGSISNPNAVLSTSGTRNGTQVSLDVLVGTVSFSVFSIVGTLSGDVVDGTLNGAGFNNTTTRLSRSP